MRMRSKSFILSALFDAAATRAGGGSRSKRHDGWSAGTALA
jgi:hypothetical protein